MYEETKPNGRDLLVSILGYLDTLQYASDKLLDENVKALTAASDSLDYIMAQYVEEVPNEE